MALQLTKARRDLINLKLGLSAPSGAGKTLGGLLIAFGMLKELHPDWTDAQCWSKIAIIDTENKSGQLYTGREVARTQIGEYNAVTLKPPFKVADFIEAIDLCEQAGMEVCIIDSTTHLWSGQGGLLDQQTAVAKRGGNSYTAWREITPLHTKFVDKMMQSDMHIIATMRAKQEYVQEKDTNGRTKIRKVGLEPEQRKGMEYEFTTFFEINAEHEAFGSKDRTDTFDQETFVITTDTGARIARYLTGNVDSLEEGGAQEVIMEQANSAEAIAKLKEEVLAMGVELGGKSNTDLMEILRLYEPTKGNPNRINDVAKLSDLKRDLVELKNRLAREESEQA